MNSTRLFALINQEGTADTRHFVGIPPEVTGGRNYRKPLPHPDVLVIEEQASGVFLFRYTRDGDFGGDTWHMTVDDAKEQAEREYEGIVGEWRQVPPETTDAVAFALSQMT